MVAELWCGCHTCIMPKRSRKPQAKDYQQMARRVVDEAAPTAKPPTKPAANKAKPPRPVKKQDVDDIEQADGEGMAQPQGVPPPKKNPAAVELGRMGGLKGGKARAAKMTKKQRSESAKKAAQARWKRT